MTAISAGSPQLMPRLALPVRQNVSFSGQSAPKDAPPAAARKNTSNFGTGCCEGILLIGCALPLLLLTGLAVLFKKGCSGGKG
jgi:hypothetical protein